MCKNKSNLVFGVNKKNFISYIIGIVVSILFICFYFIDTRNPWCIVSSSIGAGMFSAVLLAYLIDFNNEKVFCELFILRCENVYKSICGIAIWINAVHCI